MRVLNTLIRHGVPAAGALQEPCASVTRNTPIVNSILVWQRTVWKFKPELLLIMSMTMILERVPTRVRSE